VEQPTRGFVLSLDELADLQELADDEGLPIHMDGARIFNASVAMGVPVDHLASFATTVMFCLSKGLAAPFGSVLTGPANLIERARMYRQMLGGGMRQAGVMAAAGLYALEHNIDRLAIDHENAKRLAAGLGRLPGVAVDRDHVQTNIFFVELNDLGTSAAQLATSLRESGVLVNPPGKRPNALRFVTHLGIESTDIDQAIDVAARSLAVGQAQTAR
jgi:threonine aldolase